MRPPTEDDFARAVEQVATAVRVPGLRAGVFELGDDGLAVAGWYRPGEGSDEELVLEKYVAVTLPPPAAGEDLELVARAAIEQAIEARQDELERIGFDCADTGNGAGWVVGYMYE